MKLLAPSGSREALEAAVAAGADEVYLGLTAFGARASAANFDEDAFREALAFCHLHHVRVHVTLNTLIKDAELPAAAEALRFVYEAGADAVLIQDAGLLHIARTLFPAQAVHPSTQMAIHNATGVRWCAGQGIVRAVLARECPPEEIALAARQGIETEVFCHGAQCVSVSGECLFSSMAGGRSGNRGRCAQPCRKTYLWDGQSGAWLSPRDICLRNELNRLAEAGVTAVKIEGRLKRPEYVSVVTASYRAALDAIARGAFRPADESEMDGLLQAFHRGGFMKGYAGGSEDAAVIAPERAGSGGVRLGAIGRSGRGMAWFSPERTLHDGDGLQLRTKRGDEELIYAGPEVPAGGTAALRLRPGIAAEPGDGVYRLTDSVQMAEAAAVRPAPIPVKMTLDAWPGKPLTLTVTDGETDVTVCGEAVEPATGRPASEADLEKNLKKTGGTPFTAESAAVRTAGAFVPVSQLNALRRNALKQLEEARIAAFAPEHPAVTAAWKPSGPLPGDVPETACVRTAAQAGEAAAAGLRVWWYPEDWREAALERELAAFPDGVWLRLPTVCEEEPLRMAAAFAHRHADRLGGVVLGSVGQLGVPWRLPFGASEDVPVMNRGSAAFLLEQGCAFVTASPELTGAELKTLTAGGAPILVPAWGRAQMMLLHHCPARTALGLKQGREACALCDENRPESLRGKALTDEAGRSFPCFRTRLPEGCVVRLMNALPTDVRRKAAGMNRLFSFLDETPAEVRAVLAGEKPDTPVTSGHWSRETI